MRSRPPSARAGRSPGRLVVVGRAVAALSDLVWPRHCAGCARPGVGWCDDCAVELQHSPRATSPSPRPAVLPPTWRIAAYDGVVRHAIVGWKDEGRHDLTAVLGAPLASAMRAALIAGVAAGEIPPGGAVGGGHVVVVPMPSRPSARRQRGADPLRELAIHASRALRAEGWELRVVPALRHVRRVADQAGLDARGRAENLTGALGVRPGSRSAVAGGSCLLVDDVITTGATLSAATTALEAAGAHPFGVAVVAATQLGRVLGEAHLGESG